MHLELNQLLTTSTHLRMTKEELGETQKRVENSRLPENPLL